MAASVNFDLSVEGAKSLPLVLGSIGRVLTDWKPVRKDLDRLLRENAAQVFAGEGQGKGVGAPWPALSDEPEGRGYASRKARDKPGKGILEYEGDLRKSLVLPNAAGHVGRVVGKTGFEFGTSNRLARFHHFGLGRNKVRPILVFSPSTGADIVELFQQRIRHEANAARTGE